ncbi:MAG: histidine kinase [Methylacidiphilales bacterium]|nr:histidine kinase [Candidatus Methylacidiphilales bacterium]
MFQHIGKNSDLKLGTTQIIIFILCIGLIAFTTSFFLVYLTPYNKSTSWQKVESVVPQALLKTVLSQQLIRNLDISSIQAIRIPYSGARNLYIFDYRSPQFCGAGGCLYSVYNESGNILLEFIANPYLPPKENLIQATDIDNSRFPCLIITQATSTTNIISRARYCHHNGKYIPLNQNLTEVGKDLKGEN